MPIIVEISDLKKRAQKCVPKFFFDYADSGSWSESTYRANSDDFKQIYLRQRVGRSVETIDVSAKILGQNYAMPLALAPIGFLGMQWADGEILAAKAAMKMGIPFTLSTMSVCSMEAVARATNHPFQMQLYMIRDRDFVKNFLKRAKAVNCSALMVTLDLPILAQRNKDVRNGLTMPPRLTFRNLWRIAKRPRWAMAMAGTKNRNFGNLVGHVKATQDMENLALWAHQQMEKSATWDKLKWLKDEWAGKLIVKGILDEEDAKHAVDTGADAIVVSNHGGRQLDGAPSTIKALPAIVKAVGKKTEVQLDGGITCGQDVMKALCLGAQTCYIGRSYIYGLGANQQKGVEQAIEIIKNELTSTLMLCGEIDINHLGTHNLWQETHL